LGQRFTRNEVSRMLGVEERRLAYWERLRLLRPQARWGERFYSFGDLAAVRTIQHLASHRVPARRLQRALERMVIPAKNEPAPLTRLRVEPSGRDVVVIPPPPDNRPICPLSGQYVLPFEAAARRGGSRVRVMTSRSAAEWFEMGLAADGSSESLPRAAYAYRKAVELAPRWTAARINLGTTLYQLSDLAAAREQFEIAASLEPGNPTAHFNLGCVLDDLGNTEQAMERFRRAIELAPEHVDAHFNLALALEKVGLHDLAREHWQAYVRLQPSGPWSQYARHRLRPLGHSRTPIPFRQR
jgi:DNA-binding transcriptional MerR regulator